MPKLSVILILLFSSCLTFCQQSTKQHKHKSDRHGEANKFMHQNSTDNLINHFDSKERDSYQHPQKVLNFLGDIKGMTIMDIGAGSGYFSFRLAEAGAKVIAADVDDEFQAHIEKKIKKENLENLDIELRKLPYDNPLLKEEEVEKVLMVNTYHHIEDRPVYFNKVKKGLKPGGELIIIDYFKKELPIGPPKGHKISYKTVIKELKQAGFEDLESNLEILPYQYIIRASK